MMIIKINQYCGYWTGQKNNKNKSILWLLDRTKDKACKVVTKLGLGQWHKWPFQCYKIIELMNIRSEV